MEKLPHVHCVGSSAAAIGFAHGSQLRSRIAETVSQYFSLFRMFGGISDDMLKAWAEVHQSATEAFDIDIAQEVSGISQGSGQELWKIWVLNARTEILARTIHWSLQAGHQMTPASECTSVFYPAQSILAQNWDWDAKMDKLPVLLHVFRQDKGLHILTMTEPGIVAKIGLNNHGVGCLLNILPGPSVPKTQEQWKSVPVHCLLRCTLGSSSIHAAETAIRKAPRYTASVISIGDATGYCKMVELSGAEMEVLESQTSGERLFAHTNHYLHHKFQSIPSSIAHTFQRLERVKALASTTLHSEEKDGILLVKRVLGDTSDGAESILYQGASAWGGKILAGTICSIVMDLPQRTMHITQGSAMSQDYKKVPLLSSNLDITQGSAMSQDYKEVPLVSSNL